MSITYFPVLSFVSAFLILMIKDGKLNPIYGQLTNKYNSQLLEMIILISNYANLLGKKKSISKVELSQLLKHCVNINKMDYAFAHLETETPFGIICSNIPNNVGFKKSIKLIIDILEYTICFM